MTISTEQAVERAKEKIIAQNSFRGHKYAHFYPIRLLRVNEFDWGWTVDWEYDSRIEVPDYARLAGDPYIFARLELPKKGMRDYKMPTRYFVYKDGFVSRYCEYIERFDVDSEEDIIMSFLKEMHDPLAENYEFKWRKT